jgi:hypothetical protein
MGRNDQRKEFIRKYKETHPCVDCGESDIRVLQFDHRDPSTKVDTINRIMSNKGMAILKAEVEKCDVRCANCHQIKHYEERV